jgi:hypothetical protein
LILNAADLAWFEKFMFHFNTIQLSLNQQVSGWVCENHPDKPWDKELGCECGAGVPCGSNRGDAALMSRISAQLWPFFQRDRRNELDEMTLKKTWQKHLPQNKNQQLRRNSLHLGRWNPASTN